MPAPASAVPWIDVETMIRSGVGVRETARRLGLDEERVKRQCSRKGWAPVSPAVVMQRAESTLSAARATLCPHVPTAAESLAEVNADNSRRGRAALLRYGAKASERLADMDADEGIERAPQAASVAKVLSVAGDWQAGAGAPRLPLMLFQVSGDMTVEQRD